jgi:hypothetical protein
LYVGTGANVMIAIFGDFDRFSAKMAIFLKSNVLNNLFHKLAEF